MRSNFTKVRNVTLRNVVARKQEKISRGKTKSRGETVHKGRRGREDRKRDMSKWWKTRNEMRDGNGGREFEITSERARKDRTKGERET